MVLSYTVLSLAATPQIINFKCGDVLLSGQHSSNMTNRSDLLIDFSINLKVYLWRSYPQIARFSESVFKLQKKKKCLDMLDMDNFKQLNIMRTLKMIHQYFHLDH